MLSWQKQVVNKTVFRSALGTLRRGAKRPILLTLTSVAFCGSTFAAYPEPLLYNSTKQDVGAFIRHLRDLRVQGKYLQGLVEIDEAAKNGVPGIKEYATGLLPTYYSLVGSDEVSRLTDSGSSPTGAASAAGLEDAQAQDALKAIARAAQSSQIVILNEAHDAPRCRAFALEVAVELQKQGFGYFAAEAFDGRSAEIWRRGYADTNGLYTTEPIFGDLIRQAIKLGLKPIDYEAQNLKPQTDPYEGVNERDRVEAENLAALLKRDPSAKVFIYCGYGHALEEPQKVDGHELRWMACRLKQLTGIDPVTVDQTHEIPHSSSEFDTPEMKYAISGGLSDATAFQFPSGKFAAFGAWKNSVDIQVFHAKAERNGRPSWLSMHGYRSAWQIPAAGLAFIHGKVIVQAFVASEKGSPVPMDQVIVDEGKPIPSLMLPQGNYKIVLQYDDGTSKALETIQMK